jgi:hypothetical protein
MPQLDNVDNGLILNQFSIVTPLISTGVGIV